jgi:hypothetical protein
MAAIVTFKVTSINPGGTNMAQVNFEVSATVEGGPPVVTNIGLTFPRDIGKEFELDDTYSLQIAPKAEGQH